MNFPAPPSNPVTNAVSQAAEKVVETAEEVFDAAINTTSEVLNTDIDTELQRTKELLNKSMELSAAVREEVKREAIRSVDAEGGTVVQIVMVIVAVTVLAIASAISVATAPGRAVYAAGAPVVRTTLAVGQLLIAIAEFVARTEQERARRKSGDLRREMGRLGGKVSELVCAIQRERNQANQEYGRGRQEREQILAALEKTARLLPQIATAVTGASSEGDAGRMHAKRLDQAASKLQQHFARRPGLGLAAEIGALRDLVVRAQRPRLEARAGLGPWVR